MQKQIIEFKYPLNESAIQTLAKAIGDFLQDEEVKVIIRGNKEDVKALHKAIHNLRNVLQTVVKEEMNLVIENDGLEEDLIGEGLLKKAAIVIGGYLLGKRMIIKGTEKNVRKLETAIKDLGSQIKNKKFVEKEKKW